MASLSDFDSYLDSFIEQDEFISLPPEQRGGAMSYAVNDYISKNSELDDNFKSVLRAEAENKLSSYRHAINEPRYQPTQEELQSVAIPAPTFSPTDTFEKREKAWIDWANNNITKFAADDYRSAEKEDIEVFFNSYANQGIRESAFASNKTSNIGHYSYTLAQGLAEPLARYFGSLFGGPEGAQEVDRFFAGVLPEDPSRKEELGTMIAAGIGDVGTQLAISATGGFVGGILGGPGGAVAGASIASSSYNIPRYMTEGFNREWERTGNESQSWDAAVSQIPAALLETAGDMIFMRAGSTMRGFAKQFVNATDDVAKRKVLSQAIQSYPKAAARGFVSEGAVGGIGSEWASGLGMAMATGNDEYYKQSMDGLLKSGLAEGVVGAMFGVGANKLQRGSQAMGLSKEFEAIQGAQDIADKKDPGKLQRDIFDALNRRDFRKVTELTSNKLITDPELMKQAQEEYDASRGLFTNPITGEASVTAPVIDTSTPEGQKAQAHLNYRKAFGSLTRTYQSMYFDDSNPTSELGKLTANAARTPDEQKRFEFLSNRKKEIEDGTYKPNYIISTNATQLPPTDNIHGPKNNPSLGAYQVTLNDGTPLEQGGSTFYLNDKKVAPRVARAIASLNATHGDRNISFVASEQDGVIYLRYQDPQGNWKYVGDGSAKNPRPLKISASFTPTKGSVPVVFKQDGDNVSFELGSQSIKDVKKIPRDFEVVQPMNDKGEMVIQSKRDPNKKITVTGSIAKAIQLEDQERNQTKEEKVRIREEKKTSRKKEADAKKEEIKLKREENKTKKAEAKKNIDNAKNQGLSKEDVEQLQKELDGIDIQERELIEEEKSIQELEDQIALEVDEFIDDEMELTEGDSSIFENIRSEQEKIDNNPNVESTYTLGESIGKKGFVGPKRGTVSRTETGYEFVFEDNSPSLDLGSDNKTIKESPVTARPGKVVKQNQQQTPVTPTQQQQVVFISGAEIGNSDTNSDMGKFGDAVVSKVQEALNQGKRVTLITDNGKKRVPINEISGGMMQDEQGQKWGSAWMMQSSVNGIEISNSIGSDNQTKTPTQQQVVNVPILPETKQSVDQVKAQLKQMLTGLDDKIDNLSDSATLLIGNAINSGFNYESVSREDFNRITNSPNSGKGIATSIVDEDTDTIRNLFVSGEIDSVTQEQFENIITEETFHGAAHRVKANNPELWNAATNEVVNDEALNNKMKEIYSFWDDLTPSLKTFEAIRAINQGRYNGKVTNAFEQILQKFLEYVDQIFGTSKNKNIQVLTINVEKFLGVERKGDRNALAVYNKVVRGYDLADLEYESKKILDDVADMLGVPKGKKSKEDTLVSIKAAQAEIFPSIGGGQLNYQDNTLEGQPVEVSQPQMQPGIGGGQLLENQAPQLEGQEIEETAEQTQSNEELVEEPIEENVAPATNANPAIDQDIESSITEEDKAVVIEELGGKSWNDVKQQFKSQFSDFLNGVGSFSKRLLDVFNNIIKTLRTIAFTSALALTPTNSSYVAPITQEQIASFNANLNQVQQREFNTLPDGLPNAQLNIPSTQNRMNVPESMRPSPVSFQPTGMSEMQGRDFNLENIPQETLPTETNNVVTVPESNTPISLEINMFGAQASRQVVDTANWILKSGNNNGFPFIVADKRGGMLYAFEANGELSKKTPALFGKDVGDKANLNTWFDDESAPKVTPTGRFFGEAVMDSEYGMVVDFLQSNNDWTLAIHKTYLGTPSEQRTERLESEDALDNRISYGCINCPENIMKQNIIPLFNKRGGFVYILPETRSGVNEFVNQTGVPRDIPFAYIGEKAQMSELMQTSLDTAKVMALSGKNSEEIRSVTGWFPGFGKGNEKLRFEIPDKKMKWIGPKSFNEMMTKDKERKRINGSVYYRHKLGDVIEYKELFEAYPDAKNIAYDIDDSLKGEGMIKGKAIKIRPTYDVELSPERQFKTLIHEIQHWIQNKEGFAIGGSSDVVGRENYRKLAGEIEANDVMGRINFTDEQRAATAPYSSENIAPEDAIVMFGDSRDQQSSRESPFAEVPNKSIDPVEEMAARAINFADPKKLQKLKDTYNKLRAARENAGTAYGEYNSARSITALGNSITKQEEELFPHVRDSNGNLIRNERGSTYRDLVTDYLRSPTRYPIKGTPETPFAENFIPDQDQQTQDLVENIPGVFGIPDGSISPERAEKMRQLRKTKSRKIEARMMPEEKKAFQALKNLKHGAMLSDESFNKYIEVFNRFVDTRRKTITDLTERETVEEILNMAADFKNEADTNMFNNLKETMPEAFLIDGKDMTFEDFDRNFDKVRIQIQSFLNAQDVGAIPVPTQSTETRESFEDRIYDMREEIYNDREGFLGQTLSYLDDVLQFQLSNGFASVHINKGIDLMRQTVEDAKAFYNEYINFLVDADLSLMSDKQVREIYYFLMGASHDSYMLAADNFVSGDIINILSSPQNFIDGFTGRGSRQLITNVSSINTQLRQLTGNREAYLNLLRLTSRFNESVKRSEMFLQQVMVPYQQDALNYIEKKFGRKLTTFNFIQSGMYAELTKVRDDETVQDAIKANIAQLKKSFQTMKDTKDRDLTDSANQLISDLDSITGTTLEEIQENAKRVLGGDIVEYTDLLRDFFNHFEPMAKFTTEFVYGREYHRFHNYMPTAIKTLGKDGKESMNEMEAHQALLNMTHQDRGEVNINTTGMASTFDKTRGLGRGQVLELNINYLYSNRGRLNILDYFTSIPRREMSNVMRPGTEANKLFGKFIGDEKGMNGRTEVFNNAVLQSFRNVVESTQYIAPFHGLVNNIVGRWAGMVLSSFYQLPVQFISNLVPWMYVNIGNPGKMADFFTAASYIIKYKSGRLTDFQSKTMERLLFDLRNRNPDAVRDKNVELAPNKFLDWIKNLPGYDTLEKLDKGREWVQFKPFMWSDMMSGDPMLLTEYLYNLRDKTGNKTITFEDMTYDPGSYFAALDETERFIGIGNASRRGKWMNNKNALATVVRHMLTGFASHRVNNATNAMSEWRKIINPATSVSDKAKSFQYIAGIAIQSATFTYGKMLAIQMLMGMFKNMLSEGEEDEELVKLYNARKESMSADEKKLIDIEISKRREIRKVWNQIKQKEDDSEFMMLQMGKDAISNIFVVPAFMEFIPDIFIWTTLDASEKEAFSMMKAQRQEELKRSIKNATNLQEYEAANRMKQELSDLDSMEAIQLVNTNYGTAIPMAGMYGGALKNMESFWSAVRDEHFMDGKPMNTKDFLTAASAFGFGLADMQRYFRIQEKLTKAEDKAIEKIENLAGQRN